MLKSKLSLIITIITIGFLSACKKSDSIPDCINDKIETANASDNCLQAVYQYKYKKECAYAFVYDCPDFPSPVVDENCEIICSSGGFTGENTCGDFDKEAKNKELIWERTE